MGGGVSFVGAMKFGKLETLEGFPDGGFALPADAPVTGRVLGGVEGPWDVRCGGTMWTVPAWRGSVYAKGVPQRAWPEAYGRAFGTIEFNATHYRIHPADRMAEWAAGMPESFRFCAKFPQLITHFRRFANCEGPTADFIDGLLALGERRGPAFVQLPPNLGAKSGPQLLDYLAQWPRELEVAVEFRHPDWFAGGKDAERVWDGLEALGVGAVISDTAGRRDAVHMRVTAPFVLIRWGGYGGHPSDAGRMQDWVDRLGRWFGNGLREAHFLVHQPDSVHTPATCSAFADLVFAASGKRPAAPSLLPFA